MLNPAYQSQEAGAVDNRGIPGVQRCEHVPSLSGFAEDGSKGMPHKQGRQCEVHLSIVADKSP